MGTHLELKFKFVGGRVCLDFTNSVGGRKNIDNGDYTIVSDKFQKYNDLVDWGKAIGILNESTVKKLTRFASQNEKAADKVLKRSITLRESLYRIFKDVIKHAKPSNKDVEVLNKECAIAYERQRLVYSSGKFDLGFKEDDEPDRMLWSVALSGKDLLLSDQLHRLKQCHGENCGWLFLDTSKNKSRQWCDMKDCGNIAKVRRYRKKHE